MPAPARLDPRYYQIAILGSLLAYGILALEFEVTAGRSALILATVLVAQYVCTRLWRLPAFDPRSALISGLSLCLLLRTGYASLAVVAAVVTIASKFLLRIGGKHIFNPTNFGIVVAIAATGQVWVSPGQWGSTIVLAFLFACLGGLVVNRAARSDVSLAFLGCWTALILGRSIWLGDPLDVPFHRLESGALLLFTFFMISDPKTTPDSRAGRIVFAALVALGAYYVQFKLFRTNGLLWSLVVCSPLVPLIDRLLPGDRYDWRGSHHQRRTSMIAVTRIATLLVLVILAGAERAAAFCGFYVGKADAKIFNRASQVVLVRDGDRTVMTMANDFKGELREFAIVIPVPTSIQRDQINVGDRTLIDHLDAYSAPRLVEYFDEDPCNRWFSDDLPRVAAPMAEAKMTARRDQDRSLGVTIEARYTVGEYDILILSATQSTGLETWLRENGYRIPEGAAAVLGSYIKQNMRFFVARVNLKEQAKLGFSYLRPLQVAYESPKFMLPIRLGMINANGPQELYLYTLTRKGRVETTNYRTVKLPTDMELPTFVKNEFGKFYGAMFGEQVRRQDMRTVFVEYAWDMGSCDPCSADPLSNDQLRRLGVFWLDDVRSQPVFVTRLHARYDSAHFPDDLVLQETADRESFQGRYVLRHPWTGRATCAAAARYRAELQRRNERDARTLASLTGWNLEDIRTRMPALPVEPAPDPKWWNRLWK